MRTFLLACAMLGLALSGPARAATNVERQLEQLAVALEQLGRADEARRFREAVAATPPQDLEAVYGDTDLTPLAEKLFEAAPLEAEVQAGLAESRATALARASAATLQTARPPESILSHGNGPLPEAPWPDISGDFCDAQEIPGRTTSDTHEGFVKLRDLNTATKTVEQFEILYAFARGVWDGLSRACDQTTIVAGSGANTSLACLPIDIVLAVAELLVAEAKSAVEFVQMELDMIGLCDGAVETAQMAGTYKRLGHLHEDLQAFKASVRTRLAEAHRQADLVLEVLLEGDLREKSVRRLNVNYTTRLEEACDEAQAAIDETAAAGYSPTPQPQALVDAGRKAMATDPKRAFDYCQAGYRLVTSRGTVRRR